MQLRSLSPALPVLGALALATACGSSGGSTTASQSHRSSPEASSPSTAVGSCRAGNPALSSARTLTSADLDGDGSPERVRLTTPGGACGNTLFARLGRGYVSAPLADPLPVPSAQALRLRPDQAQLVAVRQVHPRGGFGYRVYAYGEGKLRELTDHGNPLVPFVATDAGDPMPLSADCADGRLTVTSAQRQQPPGIVAAWKVTRTTYDVAGGGVTGEQTRQVDDNALDASLDRSYPGLRQHRMFQHC